MERIGRYMRLGGALVAALVVSGTLTPARAGATCETVCYDFDELVLMNQYHVGDTFVAADATIHLESYLRNGNLISLAGATAYANNSNIAKGTRPELRTYFITNRVVPDIPLTSVTFRFGQIVAPNGPDPHSNLGVNGDLREVAASLATMNGQVIGDPATGQAEVLVTLDAALPGSKNILGTLELRAVSGTINEFTFGGVQLFIDDLCMKK